jgi:hypothetical protein
MGQKDFLILALNLVLEMDSVLPVEELSGHAFK